MAMARRLNGLAAVSRAITGASSPSIRTSTHHQLYQAALYGTGSSSSMWSRWLSRDRITQSSRSSATQGVVLFSTATAAAAAYTILAQEVDAKEPITSPKFAPNEIVLYQYEVCPFCNKIKAFLDYYDIPYKIVEVSPLSKKEIKWSDYKKVPVVVVDGEQMVNSAAVIDKLAQRMRAELPKESLPDVSEEKDWTMWVDNHLVHVLSPNIYRSPSEALESFEYITNECNFSFYEKMTGKYVGATAMYFISKKLKKRHNIVDERASLYEAADKWVEALKGREFHGGVKPNLADLAVYGVLRPIRYLRSGKDMVENTKIGEWYSRMEKVVGEPSGIRVPA